MPPISCVWWDVCPSNKELTAMSSKGKKGAGAHACGCQHSTSTHGLQCSTQGQILASLVCLFSYWGKAAPCPPLLVGHVNFFCPWDDLSWYLMHSRHVSFIACLLAHWFSFDAFRGFSLSVELYFMLRCPCFCKIKLWRQRVDTHGLCHSVGCWSLHPNQMTQTSVLRYSRVM